MSISAFSEWLSAFGAERAKALHDEGTLGALYVKVLPTDAAAVSNHSEWFAFRKKGIPLWAWVVCSADQAGDVAQIQEFDLGFQPDGYCLDIEKQLEGQPLTTLIPGVAALGRPIVASLGGFQTASHGWLDYRTLDRYGVQCNWQAYFDSGEGATPLVAVQELYQSSFVIGGWEYRAQLFKKYGWGKVADFIAPGLARYRSFNRNALYDFAVLPRDWGASVEDRILWPTVDPDLPPAGILMGRAKYANIAVTLDVTRSAQQRPPQEWTPIAASARGWDAAGRPLGRRPVSIYLMDNCSDEVARAIAAGAAP